MNTFNKSVILFSIALGLAACGAKTDSVGKAEAVETATLPTLVLDADEGDQIAFPLHPTRRLANEFSSDVASPDLRKLIFQYFKSVFVIEMITKVFLSVSSLHGAITMC